MPGLKTLDGRGIAILRHGPRMPLFLDDLSDELAALGVRLERPLPPLSSDGVCGALGELLGARGSLSGVQNALYLAGGTGLAEALLLEGRVRALDELVEVRTKAWALSFAPGVTFEDALSTGGWRRAFARAGGVQDVMPEQAAQQGDTRAVAILARAAEALAALCALRRDALHAHGRPAPERAVVGQRLGRLLEREDLAPLLRAPAEAALAARGLGAGFLCASTLDEAPALGAASLAPWDDARGVLARGAPAC
jgi:predicted NBD/HSP70 family sugar kinase